MPDNTQHSQQTLPCPPRDSNPQSQQASGHKPTPWTAPSLESARLKYSSTIFFSWHQMVVVNFTLWPLFSGRRLPVIDKEDGEAQRHCDRLRRERTVASAGNRTRLLDCRPAAISQIYFIKYSTCFGQVHCPSSGVSQCCIHAMGICHASSVGCLLADADSQQN